ncbi:MAG: hypothetical protein LBD67_08495 [Candidatus Accumulibacter sp.]|nr:hypothetical protein [Accumulibacter sp.]
MIAISSASMSGIFIVYLLYNPHISLYESIMYSRATMELFIRSIFGFLFGSLFFAIAFFGLLKQTRCRNLILLISSVSLTVFYSIVCSSLTHEFSAVLYVCFILDGIFFLRLYSGNAEEVTNSANAAIAGSERGESQKGDTLHILHPYRSSGNATGSHKSMRLLLKIFETLMLYVVIAISSASMSEIFILYLIHNPDISLYESIMHPRATTELFIRPVFGFSFGSLFLAIACFGLLKKTRRCDLILLICSISLTVLYSIVCLSLTHEFSAILYACFILNGIFFLRLYLGNAEEVTNSANAAIAGSEGGESQKGDTLHVLHSTR